MSDSNFRQESIKSRKRRDLNAIKKDAERRSKFRTDAEGKSTPKKSKK